MLTIGLTGGIGTGKSTVAGMLTDLGATVLDADKVGHDAYAPGGPLRSALVEAFGADVAGSDGSIDRRRLGEIVFNDPSALKRLNQIVWPWIYGRIKQRLSELEASGVQVAVVEVVGLIEAGWQDMFDEIWVTVATPETVVQRLAASRGMTAQQVQQRMAAQLSNEQRASAADVIIDTEGSLEDVRRQVEKLWAGRTQHIAKGAGE